MDAIDYNVRLVVVRRLKSMGIKVPNHIGTVKLKKKPLENSFGAPLTQVVEQHGVERAGLRVPMVLADIWDQLQGQLNTVGLFRVCGSAVRMRRIEEAANRGERVSGTVHDLAGLLKSFFRELPDPLLTHRLYDSFVAAYELPDANERLRGVLLLCLELPPAHLHTLKFLMGLLASVVSQTDSKMTPSNLSAVFTPNILRPLDQDPKTKQRATTTTEIELVNHSSSVGVIELLIIHNHEIGLVPADISREAAGLDTSKSKTKYKKVTAVSRPWWRPWGRSKTPKRPSPSSEKKKISHLTSKATLDLLHGSETKVGSKSPGRPRAELAPPIEIEEDPRSGGSSDSDKENAPKSNPSKDKNGRR